MVSFLQNLIFGLALGSVYALVALGYTMVYGVLKFINFAHGDMVMLGAFAGYFACDLATKALGLPLNSLETALFVLTFSALFCGSLAFLMERLAYRPLRKSPRLTALITAIGISLLIENLAQLNLDTYLGIAPTSPVWAPDTSSPPAGVDWWPFHPNPRAYPPFFAQENISLGGIQISNVDLINLALSAFCMVALYVIVYRTKFGRALRAVSHNPDVAALIGIPVDRVISLTFVLGAVLASVAGTQYGLRYYSVDALMGVMLGLKAFVAAVLGGIGSIPGAMLGGLLMGVSEQFVVVLGGSTYKDAFAFGILIAVLLFRPKGIMGKVETEKV